MKENCCELAREKGREDIRIEVAKKMIEHGFNPKMIGKITGLSNDKIKKLKP